MIYTSLRQADCIAVAVAFDDHTLNLVEAGAALAVRLGKKLCLLHVVEPWMEREHAAPLSGENDPFWNASLAVETNARTLALARLKELASSLPGGLNVRQLVVTGRPAETLCREAQKMGAGLLLLGAGGRPERHWFTGYSTALAVMASASVPVLAAGAGVAFELASEHLKVLVADDLGSSSASALEFGCNLLTGLGGGELSQLHVCGVTPDALETALTAAVAASHSPGEPAAASDLHAQLLGSLRSRLERRAAPYLGELRAADCLYTARVVAGGRVFDELAAVVQQEGPDVLVFGRHHVIHTEPFFVGRLPAKAMLQLGTPIIVVPSA